MMSLKYWQDKFEYAKQQYQPVRDAMDHREAVRLGTKEIQNKKGGKAKSASNVRKIAYELIETQVDSTIPQPKVTPTKEKNAENAKKLEDKLRNELDRMPFEAMNDEQERISPTQGGVLFLVEWDSTKHTHNTNGELVVTSLHPNQVIPQPGVYEIERMDYIFVLMSRTKEYIRRRYGVEIEQDGGDTQDISINVAEIKGSGSQNERESVTQVMCYFRNENGGIGLISWVNDTVLEDFEDYQARRGEKCKVCGAERDGDVCMLCGSSEFTDAELEEETIPFNVMRTSKTSGIAGDDMPEIDIIPAGTRVPYYKPDVYPITIRKNVSMAGSFLGGSDIDIIEDQQNAVAKLGTKVEEKILKAGSIVTLPQDPSVKIRSTDEECKEVRITTPAQKNMIGVFALQPNVQADLDLNELNYQWARSTLGITDSFQGKRDSTATSGKAKEFSANQAAGRLESKRVMKRAAFAELFEVMAKFLIAYTDEPRTIRSEDENGTSVYTTFSKYDFLERDETGQWYYNVDYLFSTDNAATLASNREAMWQEMRMNYSTGCFGDPTNPETQLLFWQMMASLGYPMAERVKTQIEDKIKKQEQQMQAMQAMQQMQAVQQPGMMPGAPTNAATPLPNLAGAGPI